MSDLTKVPIKELPLFKEINKSDHWYGLIPDFFGYTNRMD